MKRKAVRPVVLGVCLGIAAFLAVVSSIDVANECNWTMEGPGLTYDENLNTAGGVLIVESAIQSGLAILDPRTMQEIFNSPNYTPDYPPLGRLPLGISNAVLSRVVGLGDHEFYLITYARVGSAACFGLLVALITWFSAKCGGTISGLAAGIACATAPRVFGHAHLANVEIAMNLTYVLCVIVCLECLAHKTKLKWYDGIIPGLVVGLALLTKMQGIFLPPVIAAWLFWGWGRSAILPLIVIAITSALVFVGGWPWLWSDPIGRGLAYFAQTSDRAVLYCEYFGTRYADKNVPWHYPFVMFVVTAPIVWLLLGGWYFTQSVRSRRRRRKRVESGDVVAEKFTRRHKMLLLGSFLFPLIVFALPRVPVYDGERLFQMVWPIFAIMAGLGAEKAFDHVSQSTPKAMLHGLCILSVIPAMWNIQSLYPLSINAYGVQIGLLRGASMLGLERCYWGDSLTASFLKQALNQIPENSTVAIAPVLHPLYPKFMKNDSWLRNRPDINLVPFEGIQSGRSQYVLVVHRDADQWRDLVNRPVGTKVLQRIERQGVVLAELLLLPDGAKPQLSFYDQQKRDAVK
ncbi:ArnT family glycosyltransferase [Planctomicrobium sp. SH668]|uniref:ArnT family glycosyltransferase n=1 Tax=Planctomicrobium sp. SH668 TaxID=3448126 RepID=UPI003F5B6891